MSVTKLILDKFATLFFVKGERSPLNTKDVVTLSSIADLNESLIIAISSDVQPETEELLHEINRNPAIANTLICDSAYTKYSKQPVFNLIIGSALFGSGKPDLASMYFNRAVELTTHSLPTYCLARSYAAMGQDDRAFKMLRDGIGRFPNDIRLAVEASTALFRMGNIDDANQFFGPYAKHFQMEQSQCLALAEELKRAISCNMYEREAQGDLYDDKFVTALWWDYNQCFNRFNEFQEGTAFMGHLIRKAVELAIRHEPSTKALVDFGVMCGLPNWRMAERFPLIEHFGIDRQPLIQELNTQNYQRENLHFEAGDIFDFLQERKHLLKGGTLFHARTATVCYPSVIRDLYNQCRHAGIKQIVVIEFCGLSKESLEFTDFRGAKSVALRSNMFIHPYESMLADAGYQIDSTNMFSKYGLFLDAGIGEATACTVARI